MDAGPSTLKAMFTGDIPIQYKITNKFRHFITTPQQPQECCKIVFSKHFVTNRVTTLSTPLDHLSATRSLKPK